MKYNILVTGTSSYGVGEGIIKVIAESKYRKQINLIGASNNNLTAFKMLLENYYVLPNADAEEYILELEKVIVTEKIKLIIPGSENEMVFFSQHKDAIEKKFNLIIWVNNYNFIKKFNNKIMAEEFFNKNNFLTPKSSKEFRGNKMLIKPIQGKGSEGIYIVDNKEKFDNIKKIYSLFGRKFICQEFIDGEAEYTVSLICSKKNPKILIMERILNKGATQFSKIVKDKELEKIILNLNDLFSEELIMNIQVIKSNGQHYIIEINPRFSGSSPMRSKLGYNEFDLIFSERIMKEDCKFELKEHISCVRGFIEALI